MSEFFRFARKGLFLSFIGSFALLIWTYRDIIYLRFSSGFITDLSSPEFQALLLNSFTNTLNKSVNTAIPIALGVIGAALLIYSVIHGYQYVYRTLNQNTYVNAKRQSVGKILVQSVTTRSLILNAAIIFWALYLFVWFPMIAKAPLVALSSGDMSKLGITTLWVVLLLTLLTQFGIFVSRISVRFITRG